MESMIHDSAVWVVMCAVFLFCRILPFYLVSVRYYNLAYRIAWLHVVSISCRTVSEPRPPTCKSAVFPGISVEFFPIESALRQHIKN